MHPFLLIILIPVAAALLAYLLGRLRAELSFIGSVVPLYYAVRLFLQSRHDVITYTALHRAGIDVAFRLDALSGFVLLFVAIFGALILLYSLRSMRGFPGARGFYFYALLTLAASFGVMLAANLLVLVFFWGCLLALVYGMLLVSRGDGQTAATKALVVVGLSDFALLLGVAILVVRGGWIDLAPPVAMRLADPLAIVAFLLVAAGALAKAGSMPLHSWIPAASETSPAPVMALIPASLDKLLGIYLLTRLSVYVFDISSNMTLRTVLMAVGAFTVLAAVIMALVQKRVMRLLAFHAVSQVGYMIIGIGTGVPVGIAGGLFHMMNNSLYKTGLFLSAGSVESYARTDKIDELGGLAGKMPLTFVAFLIAAMAIAGVPPLNGFVSKWMVYQGIVDVGREGNKLYPAFLIAAMLGSVLTLASFLKLLHAIFFGQRPKELDGAREVGFAMWLPPLLIALACIAFGVLAFPIALGPMIFPSLPFATEIQGIWQPVLATLLMLVALGIGAVVYLFGTARRPVAGRTYVGGEVIADAEESRVTGTAFYTPVKQLPILGEMLRFGGIGSFDLFNWLNALLGTVGQLARAFNREVLERLFRAVGWITRAAGRGLSFVSNGFLPLYVAWVFVGAVVFYLVIVLR
jgi:formate hydrogenlyase subunit 3/multisubunit Na+/H+ antiporter MnhD subunit